MINTLNFVRGAVATKDLVPVLTHFHVYGDRIQGSNGSIVIDAPLAEPCPEFTVPAALFLTAVDTCNGEPALEVKTTPVRGPVLKVSRDSFTATLPVMSDADYPRQALPTGRSKKIPNPTEFINELKRVRPFVATDASRPWACSILFSGEYIYATNNISLVRCKTSLKLKDIAIPVDAVDELLRLDEPPIKVLVTSTVMAFIFENGAWLTVRQQGLTWPDLANMFNTKYEEPTTVIPETLLVDVQRLVPFVPDGNVPIIRFIDNTVQTADGDKAAQAEGYTWEVTSAWNAKMLIIVLSEALYADFTVFPNPVPFRGEHVEGLTMGMSV